MKLKRHFASFVLAEAYREIMLDKGYKVSHIRHGMMNTYYVTIQGKK